MDMSREVGKMRQEGAKLREIAESKGVSIGAIQHRMKYKSSKEYDKITDPERLLELAQAGETWEYIKKTLGYKGTVTTLRSLAYYHAKKRGIKLNRKRGFGHGDGVQIAPEK